MRRPFVVLAALPEEADAVLRLMHSKPKQSPPPIFKVCHEIQIGDHDSQRRCPGILVQLEGKGRMYAAVSTAYAINEWNPRFLLLVGTAGGFRSKGVALGDIIVATEVLDYESQRLGGGSPLVRWVKYQPDMVLLELARKIASPRAQRIRGAWGDMPPVHFGPLLSGDKVVASQHAVQQFLAFSENALGVEMEGAGVAFAARQGLEPVPFLMVRGVADHADEQKGEHSSIWSRNACESVARFVFVLLQSWVEQAATEAEKDER
jgi:nucleoside phosphorylase